MRRMGVYKNCPQEANAGVAAMMSLATLEWASIAVAVKIAWTMFQAEMFGSVEELETAPATAEEWSVTAVWSAK